MPTIVVPVYGELVKVGTGTAYVFDDDIAATPPTAYAFIGKSSWITQPSRGRRRQYAYPTNAYNPIDLLAGGNAQRNSSEVQWAYSLVAPQGYTGEQGAYWLERQVAVLEALIRTPNTDGTSGELQPLSVKFRVNSTVGSSAAPTITTVTATASAALANVDTTEPSGPFSRKIVLTFALYSEFSY